MYIQHKMTTNIPITEILPSEEGLSNSPFHTTWNTYKSILKSLLLQFSFTIQRAKQWVKSTGNRATNQSHCTYEPHNSFLFPFHCASLLGLVTSRSGFTCILVVFLFDRAFASVYVLVFA